jgi:predicted GNAT family N-acyltransferase
VRTIRSRVFIEEQGIPAQLEWDGQDDAATHFIAETGDGQAIGTARLLASGQIGRMAVLPAQRRYGVGRLLVREILDTARQRGFRELFLHAQLSAAEFYRHCGFQATGEVFDTAGIPHQTMRMTVQNGDIEVILNHEQ